MQPNTVPNSIIEASLPCPPRALWHELPPSLGSGIPNRVRSARPIPPRSIVTDLLPLHPPSFSIGAGELRPTTWTAPDREPILLEPAEPASTGINPRFPACAPAMQSLPRVPVGAELGMWTATDDTVPSIACCQFARSNDPVLPSVGAKQSAVAAVLAPAQSAWNLTNTFFTPRRSILPPEPAMRPLPKPEAGSRPLAAAKVWPTQTAEIVDNKPWKLVENGRPVIAGCPPVVQILAHQLAKPRPAADLRPQFVFEDTVSAWTTVPNSFVRRIDTEFFTDAATLVSLSLPLPALAH